MFEGVEGGGADGAVRVECGEELDHARVGGGSSEGKSPAAATTCGVTVIALLSTGPSLPHPSPYPLPLSTRSPRQRPPLLHVPHADLHAT